MALGSPSLMFVSFFTESFECTVLDRAIGKPLQWFQYVHDNLFNLPYGPEKLKGFPDQLNTYHQNIQFSMEMAIFLDIDIYKRHDGSQDYKLYCKPTNTNPYLNSAFITIHPTSKPCFLHWCTELCVFRITYMMN
jgi:hypothetical protein